MSYEYKMVQIPPNISVDRSSEEGDEAAQYLEDLANDKAQNGWEFYRVDTVGVVTKPGCLASIFGADEERSEYYVVTFRKES